MATIHKTVCTIMINLWLQLVVAQWALAIIIILWQYYIEIFLYLVLYAELGTGLDQHLVYSLLYILNVLMILTEGSKGACEYLVNSGSLYQNFFELEELKKTLSGDEVRYWPIWLVNVDYRIMLNLIGQCKWYSYSGGSRVEHRSHLPLQPWVHCAVLGHRLL